MVMITFWRIQLRNTTVPNQERQKTKSQLDKNVFLTAITTFDVRLERRFGKGFLSSFWIYQNKCHACTSEKNLQAKNRKSRKLAHFTFTLNHTVIQSYRPGFCLLGYEIASAPFAYGVSGCCVFSDMYGMLEQPYTNLLSFSFSEFGACYILWDTILPVFCVPHNRVQADWICSGISVCCHQVRMIDQVDCCDIVTTDTVGHHNRIA